MNSWDDCLENFCARKVTPDKGKAFSLIETSKERLKVVYPELNEKSANFIFESYYTSILELLQAIVILEGFNVKNHICLGFYLRDIIKKQDLFKTFDNLRFKRNSLVYYGKMMEFEVAKKGIIDAKILLAKLNVHILEKFNF